MHISRPHRRGAIALASITLATALVGGVITAQAHDSGSGHLTGPQRTVVEEATRQFRDVDRAIAAGYLPTDECSELAGVGAMGYHFLNPALASDARIDPTQPEVLLYRKDSAGRFVLAGAEWFMADGDQDLSTDSDRPTLFGHPFDGPMPGHDASMPAHYDLHVWTEFKNPTGELSAWNPRLTCPNP